MGWFELTLKEALKNLIDSSKLPACNSIDPKFERALALPGTNSSNCKYIFLPSLRCPDWQRDNASCKRDSVFFI